MNIIISLLGYDRFAVLRPSMSFEDAELDVSSIKLTSQPTKTEYLDGEEFDAAGMVVTATLNNGRVITLTDYTVSPIELIYGTKSVGISLGELYVDVPVSVSNEKPCLSVDEMSQLDVEKSEYVKGIVVGVAHEGLSNDKELLIKDLNSDTVIAVRDIPYGKFPNFGYEVGDIIVFKATVKKDKSSSTCYDLKKYLEFHSENGDIESTIISKGNKVSY